MSKLFNLKFIKEKLGKIGKERLIYYAGFAVLLSVLFIDCGGEKVVELPLEVQCIEFAKVYADSMVKEAAKTRIVSHDTNVNPPPTEVVKDEDFVLAKNKKYIRTYNELQDLKLDLGQALERLSFEMDDKSRILALLNKTKEEFDALVKNDGGVEVEINEHVFEQEIVRTDLSKETDDYKIEENTWSSGPLKRHERTVTIKEKDPVVVTVTEKEFVKMKQFLAFKFGYLNLDNSDEIYFTPSIEYGFKNLLLEVGSPMDKDFNFNPKNIEASVGLVIKIK